MSVTRPVVKTETLKKSKIQTSLGVFEKNKNQTNLCINLALKVCNCDVMEAQLSRLLAGVRDPCGVWPTSTSADASPRLIAHVTQWVELG